MQTKSFLFKAWFLIWWYFWEFIHNMHNFVLQKYTKMICVTNVPNFSVSFRAMSSAATTPPSVDKVDGFSRKSVRKAKQKRSQSSSQFRSQGKPIELTPLPLLKGDTLTHTSTQYLIRTIIKSFILCFYFQLLFVTTVLVKSWVKSWFKQQQ